MTTVTKEWADDQIEAAYIRGKWHAIFQTVALLALVGVSIFLGMML